MKICNLMIGMGLLCVLLISCSSKKMAHSTHSIRNEIHFRFDSDHVISKYDDILLETVMYLKGNPQAVVVIEGHTDQIGTKSYNIDLGDKRSLSVKAYLIKHGIEPSRLITVSYGEDNPKNLHPYKQNRRVLISNHYQFFSPFTKTTITATGAKIRTVHKNP